MSQDKVEVAKRAVDAYNRRDVDIVFAELATADFEWLPALTRALDGGGYRGREGVNGSPSTPAKTGRTFKPSRPSIAISAIACS